MQFEELGQSLCYNCRMMNNDTFILLFPKKWLQSWIGSQKTFWLIHFFTFSRKFGGHIFGTKIVLILEKCNPKRLYQWWRWFGWFLKTIQCCQVENKCSTIFSLRHLGRAAFTFTVLNFYLYRTIFLLSADTF